MPRPKFEAAVQSRYQTAMGADLGSLYLALLEDLLWLHDKWEQFSKLYSHSDERVALLNRAAGYFFSVIEEVQWQDIVLHLARLTDPPQTFGKHNLSLRALPALITDSSFKVAVGTLLATVETQTAFAREWRNRQLAHTDRALALQQSARALPTVNRGQISAALAAMRDLLNALELKYCDGTMVYEMPAGWDAEALVRCLEEREESGGRETM